MLSLLNYFNNKKLQPPETGQSHHQSFSMEIEELLVKDKFSIFFPSIIFHIISEKEIKSQAF
jgi:hypothetical protein